MSLCVSLCVSACVSEHPSIPYVRLWRSVYLGTSACVWISVCFCVCVRISLWLLCVYLCVSLSHCVSLCFYVYIARPFMLVVLVSLWVPEHVSSPLQL